MKSHPTRGPDRFAGQNDTDEADRIEDVESELVWNLVCTPKGRLVKWPGFYDVTTAENVGVTDDTPKTKIHRADRFRGKTGIQRGLLVVGTSVRRSQANNVYDLWPEITFPTDVATPTLNRVCAIGFLNGYGYIQDGESIPFRVKMEERDGSDAATVAEILGLRPPPYTAMSINANTVGVRFPVNRTVTYAVTYVYGDRGESGPSPLARVTYDVSGAVQFDLAHIPIGPAGVTKRRIYRSKIGYGKVGTATPYVADRSLWELPGPEEMFFLAEISDNTTNSYSDTIEDNGLDANRRMPPARIFPPRAKYQLVHQDRFAWANLREHPFVLQVATRPAGLGFVGVTVTVSNVANGTITFDLDDGVSPTTLVIDDYKTKTLAEIRLEINQVYNAYDGVVGGDGPTTSGLISRVAPGVDDSRTYIFHAVTAKNIYPGSANAHWFEAIDDEDDPVSVDGCERFPARVMWSNLGFLEELNPLNFADVSRHDLYPINGLFREDFTLGVGTQNDVWLLTGTFAANPFTFRPEFSIGRSQAEHGPLCPRPDACAQTPYGWIYPAVDGLRIFRGQSSQVWGHPLNRRIFARILRDPQTRDNFFMHYDSGILYVFYAGEEVS